MRWPAESIAWPRRAANGRAVTGQDAAGIRSGSGWDRRLDTGLDAHTQEWALFPAVLERVHPSESWIADRNFCMRGGCGDYTSAVELVRAHTPFTPLLVRARTSFTPLEDRATLNTTVPPRKPRRPPRIRLRPSASPAISVIEEYLRQRDLHPQQMVTELLGTLAADAEGTEVVEQHDPTPTVGFGQHLVVAEAVETAIQTQMRRRRLLTPLFVLGIGVQQVELRFQRIGVYNPGCTPPETACRYRPECGRPAILRDNAPAGRNAIPPKLSAPRLPDCWDRKPSRAPCVSNRPAHAICAGPASGPRPLAPPAGNTPSCGP